MKYAKMQKYPALEVFHCLPPLFRCLPLWKTVRLHGKKLQNATKAYCGTLSEITLVSATYNLSSLIDAV